MKVFIKIFITLLVISLTSCENETSPVKHVLKSINGSEEILLNLDYGEINNFDIKTRLFKADSTNLLSFTDSLSNKSSSTSSEETLILKKGWNVLGISSFIEKDGILEILNNDLIVNAQYFDSNTQSFISLKNKNIDSDIEEKIDNILNLKNLALFIGVKNNVNIKYGVNKSSSIENKTETNGDFLQSIGASTEENLKKEIEKEEYFPGCKKPNVEINGVIFAGCYIGDDNTFDYIDNKYKQNLIYTYIDGKITGYYWNRKDSSSICPSGWRLPSKKDFSKMGQKKDYRNDLYSKKSIEENAPGKLLSSEGITSNIYLFWSDGQFVNAQGYYYAPEQDTGLNMALLDYDKEEEAFRHVRCVKSETNKAPSCDKDNIIIGDKTISGCSSELCYDGWYVPSKDEFSNIPKDSLSLLFEGFSAPQDETFYIRLKDRGKTGCARATVLPSGNHEYSCHETAYVLKIKGSSSSIEEYEDFDKISTRCFKNESNYIEQYANPKPFHLRNGDLNCSIDNLDKGYVKYLSHIDNIFLNERDYTCNALKANIDTFLSVNRFSEFISQNHHLINCRAKEAEEGGNYLCQSQAVIDKVFKKESISVIYQYVLGRNPTSAELEKWKHGDRTSNITSYILKNNKNELRNYINSFK